MIMAPSFLQLGKKSFPLGIKTYVMGILNLTPDSFSGDGISTPGENLDSILYHAEKMISDGADLLDIGGESTRPGAEVVSADEEIERVARTIEAIVSRLDVVISIDTYKAKVAEIALNLGASIVNDVWAMEADPQMAAVVKRHQATIVLMHNSSDPSKILKDSYLGNRYASGHSGNVIEDIKIKLQSRIDFAIQKGIEKEKIILDPGFGFGKDLSQNLRVLAKLEEFKSLGFPLLSGPSRKSFIGHSLKLPVSERLEGTLAAVALSIERGADIVRVHDVKAVKRVASFVDAVMQNNS